MRAHARRNTEAEGGEETMNAIRVVEPGDLNSLMALYRHLNPNDSPSPPEPELLEHWRVFLAQPGLTCLVVCDGSVLAASCCLVVIPNLTRGCRPYAVIENVVTDANYRRRGLGTAVLKRALALAWEKGCYKAMLLSGSKRPETLRFYERCGFVMGEKTGFVARPS
jgi:ribosomal protein S18 acetylase RimI-like enzyme